MKLSLDAVTKLAQPVLRLIKREPEARDAFGGEELFDGDSRPSGMGPKIALAASGAMFLALIGLVGTFLMSADEVEPASGGGSLADLQLEEDAGASGDDVAATDRSVERRPWLTTIQSSGTRLGLDEPARPSSLPAPAETGPAIDSLPTRDVETAAVMKPPPAGQDTQAARKPEPEPVKADAPKVEAPKTEPAVAEAAAAKASSVDDLMAMTKTDEPRTANARPEPASATTASPVEKPGGSAAPSSGLSGLAMDEEPEQSPDSKTTAAAMTVPPSQPAAEEIPSLLAPPENVPGAPRRFATAEEAAAPTSTGGRPRLNEPRVPPIAKAAIAAPPPRYATLSDYKSDKVPPAPVSGSKVAVVIEGLGLSQAATEAAINRLPTNVTLAFSPYARDLKRWIDRAKAKGHEVLIEVPMEGKAFPAEDPGPLGLLTVIETKENTERLDLILKAAAGASGIYDGQGSKFRESEEHINSMFTALKDKNLFYVQGRPGVRVGEATVPTATADVIVDERPFRAAVDARFDYAERLAKYQGSSVAVMSAKPVSYERLALWIEQLPAKGVSLTPVSGVLIR